MWLHYLMMKRVNDQPAAKPPAAATSKKQRRITSVSTLLEAQSVLLSTGNLAQNAIDHLSNGRSSSAVPLMKLIARTTNATANLMKTAVTKTNDEQSSLVLSSLKTIELHNKHMNRSQIQTDKQAKEALNNR